MTLLGYHLALTCGKSVLLSTARKKKVSYYIQDANGDCEHPFVGHTPVEAFTASDEYSHTHVCTTRMDRNSRMLRIIGTVPIEDFDFIRIRRWFRCEP